MLFHSLMALILGSMAGSPVYAFSQWVENPEDHVCHGRWHTAYPSNDKWMDKNLHLEFREQRGDLKHQKITSKNFFLQGHGVVLEAETSELSYEKKSMEWTLRGNVRLLTKGVVIEADELWVKKNALTMKAENVRFVMAERQIHGYAKRFVGTENGIELVDVVYTQCPPTMEHWSIQSSQIGYQQKEGILLIERPKVVAYGDTLIQGPTIKVVRDKVTNKMINLPQLKLATQGSVALRYPIRIPQENEVIDLVPEINFEYGPGLQFNIQKGPLEFRTFNQFMKKDDQRSWLGILKGYGEEQNILYDFEAGFLSDDELVYRYPDITPNIDQLYAVNYGSVKKETPWGVIQLYAEKLFRFKEARQPTFEVIENLASFRMYDYQPDYFYHAAGDMFYVYGDKTYPRSSIRGSRRFDSGMTLNAKFVHYPNESYSQAQAELRWDSSYQALSSRLGGDLSILAKLAIDDGISPQIDTVVAPLNYDSLRTLDWHHGLDWSSNGVILSPRVNWNFIDKASLEVSAAIAIDRPEKPWVNIQQPYLTAFANEQHLAPVGIKVAYDNDFEIKGLYDIELKELVYGQCDAFFNFKDAQGYISLFKHEYFPMDRMSRVVSKVTQLNFGYFTSTKEPFQYYIEAGFDLQQGELEKIRLGWDYDHCCWRSSIGMSAEKNYDPCKMEMKWSYGMTLKVELNALGFMQAPLQKPLKYLGMQWHQLMMPSATRPGYI